MRRMAALNIFGLVCLLAGFRTLGLLLFIVAYLPMLRGSHGLWFPRSRRFRPGSSRVVNTEKRHETKWHAIVSDTVLEKMDMNSADLPNGFVVVGPNGDPILAYFDKDGGVERTGTEVCTEGWLEGLGEKLPDDVLVLVHEVKGMR